MNDNLGNVLANDRHLGQTQVRRAGESGTRELVVHDARVARIPVPAGNPCIHKGPAGQLSGIGQLGIEIVQLGQSPPIPLAHCLGVGEFDKWAVIVEPAVRGAAHGL